MNAFSLFITQPRGWPHARMFVDLAGSIAHALRKLGHAVHFAPGDGAYVQNPRPVGRPILFGANFLPDVPLPRDTIIYNTEQVPAARGSEPMSVDVQAMDEWLRSDYIKLLRRHTVWDYSRENVRRLQALGVEDVHYCGIGYSPVFVKDVAAEEDIDVLFFGTMSPRRMKVLQALNDATVNGRPLMLAAVSSVYGAALDRLIARARVVLNVHMNDPGVAPRIFQMVRVAPLLANRKCVVTEGDGEDAELEAFAERATHCVIYDHLVHACRALLHPVPSAKTPGAEHFTGEHLRQAISERGQMELRRIDHVAEVRRALAESGARA